MSLNQKNTKVENDKVTTSVETKTEKAQDSLNDNTTKTMTSDKPEDNQPKYFRAPYNFSC